MALHRPQAPRPARIVVPDRRVFLLLWPLLRRFVRRSPAYGTRGQLSPRSRTYYRAAAGKGRVVVGLSALQLSPAVGHRLRPHDPATLLTAAEDVSPAGDTFFQWLLP